MNDSPPTEDKVPDWLKPALMDDLRLATIKRHAIEDWKQGGLNPVALAILGDVGRLLGHIEAMKQQPSEPSALRTVVLDLARELEGDRAREGHRRGCGVWKGNACDCYTGKLLARARALTL